MDISIEYGNLANLITQLTSQNEDFSKLLNEIDAINEDLKESWKGGDAESYTGAVTQQSADMKKLVTAISSLIEFLNKVSQAYQQAQQDSMVSYGGNN